MYIYGIIQKLSNISQLETLKLIYEAIIINVSVNLPMVNMYLSRTCLKIFFLIQPPGELRE